jgi:hypothetical protein
MDALSRLSEVRLGVGTSSALTTAITYTSQAATLHLPSQLKSTFTLGAQAACLHPGGADVLVGTVISLDGARHSRIESASQAPHPMLVVPLAPNKVRVEILEPEMLDRQNPKLQSRLPVGLQ